MGPIIKLADENDIHLVQKIASEAWPATYRSFLESDFIEFELKREYSRESLLDAVKGGEAFYLFWAEGPASEDNCTGFFALSSKGAGLWKVNKFYLRPEHKSRGLGSRMFVELEKIARHLGAQQLQLLVNRENPAVNFYQKHGFEVREEIDTPTHPERPSFIRRDFMMEKRLPG